MRFGWRSIFFAALAAVALGCTSPTLPLPPPAQPTESAGTQPNTIVLKGTGAIPTALIIVVNPDTQFTGDQVVEGTEVASDGTWTVTIQAVKGDDLQIIQLAGDETSSIDFTVEI